eukprot:1397951-Pleurochrysis_carterae.AAC.2
MISHVILYCIRSTAKQFRHTNSRYGGPDQRGAVPLSQWAPRPDEGAVHTIPCRQHHTLLWGNHLSEGPVG